jgi:hypothetical protein
MSLATACPAARLAILAAALLISTAAVLSLGAPPAAAKAKPCWERVLDDWVDNDRIDGVYSPACLRETLKHLPEDLRAYSNIEDSIKQAGQDELRTRRLQGGSGGGPGGADEEGEPRVREVEPRTGPRDEGPIQSALGYGTSDASSIPLPLIVLAVLALLLIAAGSARLVARKLKARRTG